MSQVGFVTCPIILPLLSCTSSPLLSLRGSSSFLHRCLFSGYGWRKRLFQNVIAHTEEKLRGKCPFIQPNFLNGYLIITYTNINTVIRISILNIMGIHFACNFAAGYGNAW